MPSSAVDTARDAHSPRPARVQAGSRPTLAFSHIGLYVHDLARMADFFSRVLGLAVTDRGTLGATQLVFLSGDPNEHHQLVLASGRPAEVPFHAINQISFRVADLPSLRRFVRALGGEPVTDVMTATHGNAISVYFRDPEGNRIEAFFDTPWYCEQPLRQPIDLEQPDEVVMAIAERTARAMPRFQPRDQWVADMQRLIDQHRAAGSRHE